LFINTHDISSVNAACHSGFNFISTLLTYTYYKSKHDSYFLQNKCKTRLAREKDIKKLMKIASSSYDFTRLHLDPNLPNEKRDKLYAESIKNEVDPKNWTEC